VKNRNANQSINQVSLHFFLLRLLRVGTLEKLGFEFANKLAFWDNMVSEVVKHNVPGSGFRDTDAERCLLSDWPQPVIYRNIK